MTATITDANHLPDIIKAHPWDDERFVGSLWLCRKSDGNQSDRTLHCLITPKGFTGLYEAVGSIGHKTTIRPHDRQHATLVLEDNTPEATERLKTALAANGWKNVVMRP